MTDDEHVRLACILHDVSGKVAISGYRCNLLDKLYHDWARVDELPKTSPAANELRAESLWVNYDIAISDY